VLQKPGNKMGRKSKPGTCEVRLKDCSDMEKYWVLEEKNKI
jgi:hypothetical protein